ncbi:MAG: thioredoxin domain-containing protein [Alphaproteobacteria bacterium]|nr:thioredoxin domain-containing protein [Alphaproteobacteria bacterium]
MTKKTKKKTTKVAKKPVVKAAAVSTPKKEACACGKECKCGPDCKCGKGCRCTAVVGAIAAVALVLSIVALVQVRKADPEEFVKKNPQVILESVNAYVEKLEKQQAAEEAANAPKANDVKDIVAAITKDKTNHVLGNPKGSFVMIEFFDYNCGYCKHMNKAMADAIKRSDNIRWILIDAPIFGEKSERIARYAHAAAKQGKFAEFHAELGAVAQPDEAALEGIGKKLGLNVEKLKKDANSKAAKDKIAKNREYITRLNLRGVPMFIIDGEVQQGAFGDEQMNAYIEKANAKK